MQDLVRLREAIETLRGTLLDAEASRAPLIASVHPEHRASARNLVHYLAVRGADLRPLQRELAALGLSSMGRLEGHVLDTLTRVRDRLDDTIARRRGAAAAPPPTPAASGEPERALGGDDAERMLHRHTRELLGPKPAHRHVYIMVTAPPSAEVDDAWADAVLAAGMNLLRVNGAHEEPWQWTQIVTTVRRVAEKRGVAVRVLVDLPGPKLRTVAPHEGPRVAHWRPRRDDFGRTVLPCRVTLHIAGTPPPSGAEATLGLPAALLARLAPGDRLTLRDARERRRELVIAARADAPAESPWVAELGRSAYVTPGLPVAVLRGATQIGGFEIGEVPARPFRLELAVGERLRLVGPDTRQVAGDALPVIGATLAETLISLRPGERVLFDDGKIGTVVESVDAAGAVLRVVSAPSGRARLGGEKGINLPDTQLAVPALGEDDERALAFALTQADAIGVSFVRDPADVTALYRRLDQLGAEQLGVLLKIETQSAFRCLPNLLVTAMRRTAVGVMIARGDLAVEAGFERLAELQEEILWLSEAAHLPVVWATQVLDTMARTGQAARAEITDAAMAVRAECVMLNKGPYVADAVRVLDDILRRMEQHQYKKRTLYRRLSVTLTD